MISSESKTFELIDVINTIREKLVRRHPHVFAGVQIKDEEALRKQWEMIKAQEKSKKIWTFPDKICNVPFLF